MRPGPVLKSVEALVRLLTPDNRRLLATIRDSQASIDRSTVKTHRPSPAQSHPDTGEVGDSGTCRDQNRRKP